MQKNLLVKQKPATLDKLLRRCGHRQTIPKQTTPRREEEEYAALASTGLTHGDDHGHCVKNFMILTQDGADTICFHK